VLLPLTAASARSKHRSAFTTKPEGLSDGMRARSVLCTKLQELSHHKRINPVSAAHMRPVEATPTLSPQAAIGGDGATSPHPMRLPCLNRRREGRSFTTNFGNYNIGGERSGLPVDCGAVEGCVWPALTNHSREIVASAQTAARSCGLRSRIFSDISITFALRGVAASPLRNLCRSPKALCSPGAGEVLRAQRVHEAADAYRFRVDHIGIFEAARRERSLEDSVGAGPVVGRILQDGVRDHPQSTVFLAHSEDSGARFRRHDRPTAQPKRCVRASRNETSRLPHSSHNTSRTQRKL
jgi:hypothetical protein